MKIITALILMSTTGIASASNYGIAVAKQNLCTGYGKFSVSMYEAKISGTPKSKFEPVIERGGGQPMLAFALDYAYGQAVDATSAHMATWAKCMDTYE